MKEDFLAAARSPREREILKYSKKLSLSPARVSKADLDRLRKHGLSDTDLLDLVQVISYFNYINRIADALGVPSEPDWETEDKEQK